MKSTLKQIRNIEISTKKLIDGLITGNYHSVFKGSGIEFSEIQEYKPGDDIRNIDWNVTARFNEPFIKQFIEERDLQVYFIIDISSSATFGNQISKKQKTTEITASLAYSAIKNNDNVGIFLTTDKIEKFIPARKGRKHLLTIIDQLLSFKPESKKTNLNCALMQISKIIKRRSVIFIVSDFYTDEFTKPLKILKNNQDIIAIKVNDIREIDIPEIGLIELEDPETEEQILVDTSNKEFQENYKKIIHEHNNKLKKVFRKYKIDTIEITTEQNYEKPLKKFFKLRKQRINR
jgi:uncharacterized protein (DUF58 family)